MQLVSVHIFEFKSIKNLSFDIKGNQLCLVGINECGKSSIIEAISYLNIHKNFPKNVINKSCERYPDGYPVVSGLFKLNKKENTALMDSITEPLNTKQVTFDNLLEYVEVSKWGNKINDISITLTNRKDTKIALLELFDDEQKKIEFINWFIEDIYPEIELFKNEELLIEPATVEELNSSEPKFETLRRLLYLGGCTELAILDNDDISFMSTYLSTISTKINKILNKHYKQDKSIQTQIWPHNNKFSLIIKDFTGQSFSIEERSPGFQYYFSFIVNKLYSQSINNGKKLIFLLDEPGNNLHPQGTKDLLKTFDEISESSQIIFTTHNPFLTLRNDVDSLIFIEKNPVTGTQANHKPYLKKHQVLRKELGILLNDSFLIGDSNMLVEGATEKLALHKLFQEDEFKELEWVNIYNIDGVTNAAQTLNFLGPNNLDLIGVILLDSDSEAVKEKEKTGFTKTMQSKKWDVVEINDVFKDRKERTFEDLFLQKTYLEAFNQYCQEINEIGVFDEDKPYSDIDIEKVYDLPIVNEIKKHFNKFISEERQKQNSITKQDIIRILLDNIGQKEKEEQNKELDKVNKLCKIIQTKLDKIVKENANQSN